jgi:hypothetical protein
VGPAATSAVTPAPINATAAPSTPTPSPTPAPFSALTSPVFDAHAHPPADLGLDIIGKFRSLGTAGAVVMGGPPAFLDVAGRSGGVIIPFYTPSPALPYDDVALSRMETTLGRYPQYVGIGELLARHSGRNIKRPADDPILVKMLAIASRRRLFVNLHHEPSGNPDGREAGLAELDRLLATNPEVPVIWAHLGATGPAQMRPLLRKFPNLHIDLSNRFTGTGNIDDESGQLLPHWKAIFEELPERFLFGSDLVPESPGNSSEGPNMSEIAGVYSLERRRLSQLAPRAAELIGALNFKRLLKLS